MNGILYQQYLKEYVSDAISNSDGTNIGIARYLSEIQVGGRLTRHREEKARALQDALKAFEEHRHWPTSIVLSHLGIVLD